MKLFKYSVLSLLILVSACNTNNLTDTTISNNLQNTSIASSNTKTINDEFIVKFKSNISAQNYAKENNLTLLNNIGLNMYLFKGKQGINSLKSDNKISWVYNNKSIDLPALKTFPAPVITKKAREAVTNDPLLDAQYGFFITGTDKAWKSQKGNENVIVAVIDSGVDGTHPEFKGQLLSGWDLTVKPPVAGGNVDGYGHGTHVAGVIGAKENNGIGISGIAPGCKILPIRIFDNMGHSSEGIAAAAIIWATDHGAKVINASWGSPIPGEAFHEAVKYALEKDVVLVAAVGNSGNNDPDSAGYPGKSPGAIGVAATTDIDGWASFSTYGDQVDMAAPGKGILSTYPLSKGNGYRIMEGTSMAAPTVTAAVALVRSQYPNLNGKQVKDKLEKTAKDVISTGFDVYSGFGRVDIGRAVLE